MTATANLAPVSDRSGALTKASTLILGVLALMTFASLAMAGGDTSFDGALVQISSYLEGSLGQLLAVAALLGGLVGMVIFGFRLAQVAVPVAIGVAAATGIPIVTAAVTAVV